MNVFRKLYFDRRRRFNTRSEIGGHLKKNVKLLKCMRESGYVSITRESVKSLNSLILAFGREEVNKHLAYWCEKLHIEVKLCAPIGSGDIQIKQKEGEVYKT